MKNRGFLFPVVIALILGHSPTIFADDTISVDVTGERETGETQPVSSTVTVITADEIAESGAASIVEVLELVPGIMFRLPLGGPGSEEIAMRGFGENSFGKVLILVDGSRINNPDMKSINWNAVSIADIERIEILDGGASVQYGNNAVAGVINIITEKSGKKATSITLSGGSFWENQEAISHQQSTSWGRFSLSAEHIGSQGYRKRSAYDTANAALQGTIDFSDRLSLSLRGSFTDLNYQMPGALTKAEYDADPRQAKNWADEASDHYISAGAGLEWLLSDAIEIRIPVSYKGVFSEIDMASFFPRNYSNRNTQAAEAHPAAQFKFDIKDMALKFDLGADLYFAYLGVDNYTDLKRTALGSSSESGQLNSGYYLLARFDPFKVLSVNAGVRYDFIFTGPKNDSSFFQALVYEAGVAYKPIKNVNVYAKYSTLFRYPFIDELVEWDGYYNKDLKPESGFNAEGGVGLNFTKWLTLNANVFYTELNDEIAVDMLMTWRNVNLNDTRRIGTNVSVSSNPLDFLELWASYSYVNPEFTNGPYKGKYIPMVPAHQVSGAVTFKLPLNIRIGVNMDYRGEAYQGGDYGNTLEQIDGYFLLGATVSYTFDKDNNRLMILLRGSNLLDVKYSPAVYWGGYYPGQGRAFNLSAQYRF